MASEGANNDEKLNVPQKFKAKLSDSSRKQLFDPVKALPVLSLLGGAHGPMGSHHEKGLLVYSSTRGG